MTNEEMEKKILDLQNQLDKMKNPLNHLPRYKFRQVQITSGFRSIYKHTPSRYTLIFNNVQTGKQKRIQAEYAVGRVFGMLEKCDCQIILNGIQIQEFFSNPENK